MRQIKYFIILCAVMLSAVSVRAQLHWYMDSVSGTQGSQVVVPVRVNDFTSLVSMQGTIEFDPAVVAYVGVEQFGLPGLGVSNFGTTQTGSGKLTFSWFDSDLSGETLADSSVVWAIRFNLTGNPGDAGALQFGNSPTVLEFVHSSFTTVSATYTNGETKVEGGGSGNLSLWMDSVQAYKDNVVLIPVRAADFNEITGLQGTIGWDPNVASFAGVEDFGLPGMDGGDFGTNFTSNGKLTFAWADLSNTGQSVADSTILFSIKLFAFGSVGFTSTLWFDNSPTPIEVVDTALNVINPDLTNGYLEIIDPSGLSFQLYMDSLSGVSGGQVLMPVYANGWTDLINASGTITFDPTVVSYVGVEQFGLTDLVSGDFDDSNVSFGELTFDWTDSVSSGETVSDSTVLFVIRLDVIGASGTVSEVSFTADPVVLEFEDNNYDYVPANYEPGYVEVSGAPADSITLHIDSVTTYQNNVVYVPVRASDFRYIMGIQGTIGWNPSVATFISVENFGLPGLDQNDFGTAFVNSGMLTYSWGDAVVPGQSVADSAILFEIKFFANGDPGTFTQLGFLGAPTPMEIVDSSLSTLTPHLNGGLIEIVADSNLPFALLIDSVHGMENQLVQVPVRSQSFEDILSMQGTFWFDTSVIQYSAVTNYNLPGMNSTNFGTNFVNDGLLNFSWFDSDLSGETYVDSTILFTLQFQVVGNPGDWSDIFLVDAPTPVEYTNTSFNQISYGLDSGGVMVDSLVGAINITNVLSSKYCVGDSIYLDFLTTLEVDSSNIYTIQLSDSSGSFASYSTIGSLASGSDSGTVAGYLPPTIVMGDGYRVRIVSSAPLFVGDTNDAGLNLVLYRDTLQVSVCEGDSILLGGEFRTVAGFYGDTLVATDGCDSIAVSQLTIINRTYTYDTISICNGDSLFLQGAFQDTAGSYNDTLASVDGCDSVVVTELVVLPNSFTTGTASICPGDSIFLQGVYQMTAGVYYDTLPSANGCDSVIQTTLSLYVPDTTYDTLTICFGDSTMLGGAYQSVDGNYTDVLTNQTGCDSSIITTLNVLPDLSTTRFDTVCSGDSLLAGGIYQTNSGTYVDTLTALTGCDSIVTTELTVMPSYFFEDTISICSGDSSLIFSNYETIPGLYYDSLTTDWGCDSIYQTLLIVHPVYQDTFPVSICAGDSLLVGGAYQKVTGIYTDTLSSVNGCDSIVSRDLNVLPLIQTNVSITLCYDDSLFAEGSWQKSAGVYYDTLVASGGCDSIVETTLAFYPLDTSSAYFTICAGDSMFLGGAWRTTAGIYADIYTNLNGCDSTITSTLDISGPFLAFDTVTICEGDSALIGSGYVDITGSYNDTLTSVLGCDSITQYWLNVIPRAHENVTVDLCEGDSVFAGGSWQFGATMVTDTLMAVTGCDSVIHTTVNYLPIKRDTMDLFICPDDSLFLEGAYQNTAGSYVDTFTAATGCDSIVVTNLSLFNVPETFDTMIVCSSDSVFIGGAWQKSSGTYTDTLTSGVGCDSLFHLTLNFVAALYGSDSLTICSNDSIVLGGAWQKTNGTYVDTLTSSTGCDSIVTTKLTVLPSYIAYDTVMTCNGDSLFIAGAWRTSAGTYYDSLLTVDGCDSVLATKMNLYPSYNLVKFASICFGESYFAGGAWQTIAGNYVDNYTSIHGCDSTVTTVLTVNPILVSNTNVEICEGDSFFVEGAWQITTGSYTDVYTSVLGCDSFATTNLTVHPNSAGTDNVSICAGDSVLIGGVYIKKSGFYKDTLTNSNGCDSIVTKAVDVTVLDNTVTTSGTTLTAAETTPGTTYQWYYCENGNTFLLTNETNQTYTATESGFYAVEVTNGPCSSLSDCYGVSLKDGIAENLEFPEIKAYPNPVTNVLNIEADGFGYSAIQVFNYLGEMVYSEAIQNGRLKQNLDISSYPSGMYIIRVWKQDTSGIVRITKQ